MSSKSELRVFPCPCGCGNTVETTNPDRKYFQRMCHVIVYRRNNPEKIAQYNKWYRENLFDLKKFSEYRKKKYAEKKAGLERYCLHCGAKLDPSKRIGSKFCNREHKDLYFMAQRRANPEAARVYSTWYNKNKRDNAKYNEARRLKLLEEKKKLNRTCAYCGCVLDPSIRMNQNCCSMEHKALFEKNGSLPIEQRKDGDRLVRVRVDKNTVIEVRADKAKAVAEKYRDHAIFPITDMPVDVVETTVDEPLIL